MPEYLLVSTTAGSRDRALKLVRSAVGERLAASGQVHGPVLSAFWHDDEFREGEE
jgi:periplasmic divalent cation tolerance protein